MEQQIAPGLLVAMPQLNDPNFHRSVIVMVDHGAEGSFGLTINRPGEIPVSVPLEHLDLVWKGDPNMVVGFGGPVMTSTGWLLHDAMDLIPADPEKGTIEVIPGLSLTSSTSALGRLVKDPPGHVMFLMGYAGWGPGQLFEEIESGSWLHAELTKELIFETPPGEMWERAVRSIGIDPAVLVPSTGVN